MFGRLTPLIDSGRDGREPPPLVLKILMHVVPTMRRRLRRASAWDGDEAISDLIDAWEHTGRLGTRSRTAQLRSFDASTMTDDQLAYHMDECRGTCAEPLSLTSG